MIVYPAAVHIRSIVIDRNQNCPLGAVKSHYKYLGPKIVLAVFPIVPGGFLGKKMDKTFLCASRPFAL